MIKLLVADDEPGICDALEETFSSIGFTVFKAGEAKKALAIFKKEKPKIVFLDYVMPEISGLDLLKLFKEIDPNCIINMLTAYGTPTVKEQAKDLGISAFVDKSVDHLQLIDLVEGQIENILIQGGEKQIPNIVLADDEKDVLEYMGSYIKKRIEANIETAKDGEEAIEQVKKFKPDLIVLDNSMPKKGGIEIIPTIREIQPNMRIIMLTAWNSTEVAQEAFQAGAHEYIAKTGDIELTFDKIKAALMSIGKYVKKV